MVKELKVYLAYSIYVGLKRPCKMIVTNMKRFVKLLPEKGMKVAEFITYNSFYIKAFRKCMAFIR